jgi:hypothetical protein
LHDNKTVHAEEMDVYNIKLARSDVNVEILSLYYSINLLNYHYCQTELSGWKEMLDVDLQSNYLS